jgi:hypothetical protein
MDVLRHWLATDRRYSVDPTDAKYVATEDEAEQYRADGWRVDGPYVEASNYRGAVATLRQSAGMHPADSGMRAGVVARAALAELSGGSKSTTSGGQ